MRRDCLTPMAQQLATRSPHGMAYQVDEAVAFGNGQNLTTPDAILDQQPCRHAPTGCTITADLRLDNRQDLLRVLGRDADPATSDPVLALLAYLKWGTECAAHLLGDFAFAIWDPRHRTVFCARDHMGMKPFAYFESDGWFVFGSTALSVVAAPIVPREIYEPRIGDFLLNDEAALEGIDRECTFWTGVKRLPPGHQLVVNATSLEVSQYWRPIAVSHPESKTDDEYEERFREIFDEAVRCRLRMGVGGGIMLSGGIDSGAVAATAAQLGSGTSHLLTFSGVTQDPDCIETKMIRRNQVSCGLSHVDVCLSDLSGTAGRTVEDFLEIEEPFDASMTMQRQIYSCAKDRGISVLLDGVNGDLCMASGSAVLRLVRRGKLMSAYRECMGEAEFFDWKRTVGWYRFYRAIRSVCSPAFARRANAVWRRKVEPARIVAAAGIAPEFARSIDAEGRIRDMWAAAEARSSFDGSVEAANSQTHPFVVAGRERYDRAAGAFGIECRDPFMDKRVVEFCIGLPDAQKRRAGWPKHVLRRSMAGRLPPDLLWRRGFQHVGHRFNMALEGLLPADRLQSAQRAVAEYVQPNPPKPAENDQLNALALEALLQRV